MLQRLKTRGNILHKSLMFVQTFFIQTGLISPADCSSRNILHIIPAFITAFGFQCMCACGGGNERMLYLAAPPLIYIPMLSQRKRHVRGEGGGGWGGHLRQPWIRRQLSNTAAVCFYSSSVAVLLKPLVGGILRIDLPGLHLGIQLRKITSALKFIFNSDRFYQWARDYVIHFLLSRFNILASTETEHLSSGLPRQMQTRADHWRVAPPLNNNNNLLRFK